MMMDACHRSYAPPKMTGLLENPGLFLPPPNGVEPTGYDLARRQIAFAHEYLDLCREYWPTEGVASIKVQSHFPPSARQCYPPPHLNIHTHFFFLRQGHLFKFLYRLLELPCHYGIREKMGEKGNKLPEYVALIEQLDKIYETEESALRNTGGQVLAPTSWYRRHWESKEIKKEREKEPPSLMERLKIRKAKLAALKAGGDKDPIEEEAVA